MFQNICKIHHIFLSPAQCKTEMECFMLGFIISVDCTMVSKIKSATICSILCKIDVAFELLAIFQFNPPCRFPMLLLYWISYYSAQTVSFTIHSQLFVDHMDSGTAAGQRGSYFFFFFILKKDLRRMLWNSVYIERDTLFIIMKQIHFYHQVSASATRVLNYHVSLF